MEEQRRHDCMFFLIIYKVNEIYRVREYTRIAADHQMSVIMQYGYYFSEDGYCFMGHPVMSVSKERCKRLIVPG